MIYTVNLFAGPGAGKSTTAAGLFHLMKLKNLQVELVTEFVKDLVYEERTFSSQNGIYVFAKQHHRIWRIFSHYELKGIDNAYIITDSPLALSLIYNSVSDCYNELVLEQFRKFNPINFFIKRAKPFNNIGRWQTEDEARKLDEKIKNMLKQYKIPFHEIIGDENAPSAIYSMLTT